MKNMVTENLMLNNCEVSQIIVNVYIKHKALRWLLQG